MARIGFLPVFEEGHVFATFGLAAKLQKRGHEIIYLSIADVGDSVKSRGFRFVTILEDLFPRSFMTKEYPELIKSGFLQSIKTSASLSKKMFEFYSSEQTDFLLKNLFLDLIIVDGNFASFALVTCRNKIPTVAFCALMPDHRDTFAPPADKMLVPENSARKRIINALAWYAHLCRQKLKNLTMRILTGYDYTANFKSLAVASGFRLDDINFNTTFSYKLDIPTFVLCPEEFDFPRTKKRNLFYVEPAILPENTEKSALSEIINEKKQIVFCSLGSQSYQLKNCTEFFNTIIDIFAGKPDSQLIITLGRYLNPKDFRKAGNVFVYNWVAQAEVLRSCAYMINHGGLGTVKECLYYGVPMISFPFMRDQFSNAARVIYHHVGLGAKMKNIGKQKMISLISRIESDRTFKTNAKKMSDIFKQKESENKSVKLIEEFIERKGLTKMHHK